MEPGEIESVLRTVPGVREAVVIADSRGGGDPALIADWVGEADRQALFERARRQLPQYMIPSAFVRLESVPLTTSGKVDRRGLPVPEVAPPAQRQVRLPQNDLETQLAAIWSDVLGVSPIGIDQDFFSLGGTSLMVIEIRARIAKERGVNVPLRILFETPTIEAIVGLMDRPASSADPIVVHLRRGRAGVPPLFCLFGVQLSYALPPAPDAHPPLSAIHVPIRHAPA